MPTRAPMDRLKVMLGKLVSRAEQVVPASSQPLRQWYEYYFGEFELRLLPFLCSPQRVSFDVGANRGTYASLMRRYSKGVVAFEPNPQLAEYLRKNFQSTIEIEECALSDREGRTDLLIPIHPDGFMLDGHATLSSAIAGRFPGAERIVVLTSRLDAFRHYDVGFIKIDVEGHEMAVLDGGRSLIDERRPNLLVECEERHARNSVRDVESFLSGFGYSGFFVFDEKLLAVQEFNAELHQRSDAVRGSYVNNFIYTADAETANAIREYLCV